MLEDFEFDPKAAAIALVFFLLIFAMIWKFNIGGSDSYDIKTKIILTVGMIPLSYFAVNFALNKD